MVEPRMSFQIFNLCLKRNYSGDFITSLICHKIHLVYDVVLLISFKFSSETEILFIRRSLAGSIHDKVCHNE